MSERYVSNFNPDTLIKLRKERKMNQEELGKILGTSQFVISKIERGQRGITEEELKKLARYFNISEGYFLIDNSPAEDSFQSSIPLEEVKKILNMLSSNELKVLLKAKKIRGFSGLKKSGLVAKVLEVYNNDIEELYREALELYRSKVIERVKDGLDYFLNNRVSISYVDEELIKADVSGHSVVIYDIGKESFEYRCDDSCQDYIYNVKSKRVPFCKHYISVVAKLVYDGQVKLEKIPLIGEEERITISNAVDRKRKEEGISQTSRDIEEKLEMARMYYLKIARQDEHTARKIFKDSAEKVFENFTLTMFDLLEFETISNRSPQGWDGIVIGIHATPPFIVVLECKTAQSGVYDYILKHQDYLINLKVYAIDLVRDKLFGAFRDYVKYVAVIAPSFPNKVDSLKYSFQSMTGLQLSFIPADTLLYLVERYREKPVITHAWLEDLFREGGLWTREKVDVFFQRAENMIDMLSNKVVEKMVGWMHKYASIKSDAAFINFDMPMFEELLREFFQTLSPDLVVMGKKEVTGIETVRIRHDYYAIWEKVLKKVGRASIDYLKELSGTQERTTEMKAEIMRQLRL